MLCLCVSCRRNLNYFSSAYAAAVSAVDPDAGNGELSIKVPAELWKQGDGELYYITHIPNQTSVLTSVLLMLVP